MALESIVFGEYTTQSDVYVCAILAIDGIGLQHCFNFMEHYYVLCEDLKSYTENASKLTEKYFLDLRNMFSNQENIRTFFKTRKINSLRKIFLSLLQENLT